VAEDYLQKAAAFDPNHLLVLRNRAYLLERRGSYPEAIAALQTAIAVAPRRFDLYLELGRQYRVGLADYVKANEAYAQAVRVYEAPVTLGAQGEGLYNSGDHLQAVRVLRKAVEMEPNYGPAHIHLGMALYARRNYEDAAVELETGLTLVGDKARIEQLYTAGLAFINKEPSECEKAIIWLDKALQIDNTATPALQGLTTCGQRSAAPEGG
jgi:tetratricopeptide (TPR) repeat protein